MIRVYINYPMPHLTIHGDSTCGNIKQGQKKDQRHIKVDQKSAPKVLGRFRDNLYRFGATSEINDMWLEVCLSNKSQEISFVRDIKSELQKYYKPFVKAIINEHC